MTSTSSDPAATAGEHQPMVAARTRRRAMGALFVSVAAMTTSMAGTSTVSTLVASAELGREWGGAANAVGVAGTATGALVLSAVMAGRGRRYGLILGAGLAVLGASLGAIAIVAGTFWLLPVGMAMIGMGNSAAQLARYAAADLHAAERRGMALGLVVWAGTVGAVLGPSLISPAAAVSTELGVPELAGTFFLAVGLTAVATVGAVSLPRGAFPPPSATGGSRGPRFVGVGRLLRTRPVRLAVVSMVAAQVSMVALMTMTPIHLDSHGHTLTAVGWILTAHMVGMFALAPLSGRIADRYGGPTAISAGVATLLVAAVIAITAPVGPELHGTSGIWLPLALFLLGYGWNLCFVGGSSLLSRELSASERAASQGTVDALVWGASAVASLGSGTLLAIGDYGFLAGVTGVIALVPVILLIGRRPDADEPDVGESEE